MTFNKNFQNYCEVGTYKYKNIVQFFLEFLKHQWEKNYQLLNRKKLSEHVSIILFLMLVTAYYDLSPF